MNNINRSEALIIAVLQDARSKIVRPWDQFRGSVHAVRPFLPPALLHYEHRLALDYHRHLEHLNAQAQLLRHMNINMTMDLKSESGSERSSSAASDCCSPEIGSGSRLSDHHMHHSGSQQSQQSSQSHHSQKMTKPSDTPLDALFQMTNKNFDEREGSLHCCLLFWNIYLDVLFIQLIAVYYSYISFHLHARFGIGGQDFCFLDSDPLILWFQFHKKHFICFYKTCPPISKIPIILTTISNFKRIETSPKVFNERNFKMKRFLFD